jgi:hypothetical protein
MCAGFSIDNVEIYDCDKAIHNLGGLIWTGRNLYFHDNNHGLYTRKAPSNTVYSNQILVKDSKIQSNTSFGADIGQGTLVTFDNVNFDNNGTAADTATGGLVYRDTNDDETGNTIAVVKNCWFEGNKGWSLTFEATTQGVYSVDGSLFVNPESGRACRILGGRFVTMKNSYAASPTDTLTVAAGFFSMIGSLFSVVTDTSSNSHYESSADASGTLLKSLNNFTAGGTFTPTLDGTTAAGAGTYSVQDGKYARNGNYVDFSLRLVWSAHTGTGNTRVNLGDIPWAAANAAVNYPCIVNLENYTFTGIPVATLAVNTKFIAVEVMATGAANAALALDTAASMQVSGRYRITDS